jgi:hypothetical protein
MGVLAPALNGEAASSQIIIPLSFERVRRVEARLASVACIMRIVGKRSRS